MDWRDILLGLIQGATEFLPISSSGHLFLADHILKAGQSSLSFVLFLHSATLLAIFVVFFKDITSFVSSLQKKNSQQLFLKLLVSLIPLFFVGLFLRDFVQQSFEKNIVALGFFSTGLLLLSLLFVKKTNRSLEEMSFLQAFFVGLAQSLAVLPGFSRSAWTISAGLYCGLKPRSAVYFSFLTALPAVAGSALVDYIFNDSLTSHTFAISDLVSLVSSFVMAFVSGWLALLLVLKMAGGRKFYLFSFYLLPLSLAVFYFL